MSSADTSQSGKKDGPLDEVWEKEVGTAKITTEAEWTKAEVSRVQMFERSPEHLGNSI